MHHLEEAFTRLSYSTPAREVIIPPLNPQDKFEQFISINRALFSPDDKDETTRSTSAPPIQELPLFEALNDIEESRLVRHQPIRTELEKRNPTDKARLLKMASTMGAIQIENTLTGRSKKTLSDVLGFKNDNGKFHRLRKASKASDHATELYQNLSNLLLI